MKKIKIARETFEKAISVLDRVVGSVEPVNRRVYFYTLAGKLFSYASDGCLNASFVLGKLDNIEAFYAAPLDNLKLLVKGRNEDVEMRFGEKLEILTGPEYIAVTHPYARDPRRKGSFVARHEVNRKKFCHTLDVGSIILREGQEVIMGVDAGTFFLLCEENSHISASQMKLPMENFIAKIPYESVRHLLKSLDVLSQEKITIGSSENLIGIKFADGIMTLCKYHPGDMDLESVRTFLDFGTVSGTKIDLKLLKEGASLASKFQRKNGGRGYIDFSDKIRIGVLSPYSAYEYSLPIKINLKARFSILPMKLNQFLSRLHDRKITLLLRRNTLFFVGKQAIFAVKK